MKFLTDLDVVLVDDRWWRLDSALIYQSDIFGRIVVPAGFITDFASVPRVPLVYLFYANRGRRAGVVHDYLYRTGEVSRSICDRVFFEALRAEGESLPVAVAMWAGVRIGGFFCYGGRK